MTEADQDLANKFWFRKVDQSKYSEYMPEYPGLTLATHVGVKGIQVGSVLGLILPLVTAIVSKRKMSFTSRYKSYMTYTPVAGCVATLFALSYKIAMDKNLQTTDAIDDSVLGASGSLMINVLFFKNVSFIPSITTGIAFGTLYWASPMILSYLQSKGYINIKDLEDIFNKYKNQK